MFVGVPGPFELLVIFTMIAITAVTTVLPLWIICTKAGFPGWYSLAILIPLFGLLLLFFLAFAEWPALKEQRNDGFS